MPLDVVRCGDEQLGHVRHAAQRGRADVGAIGVDRHRAPAKDVEALLHGDVFHPLASLGAVHGVLGQKADAAGEGAGAVGGRGGEIEVDGPTKEFDGQLDQDASPVTAVGFCTGGAAVFEVFQGDQSIDDDGVRPPALNVGDHSDAAGV